MSKAYQQHDIITTGSHMQQTNHLEPYLSFVIPVYNEKDNIELFIKELLTFIKQHQLNAEAIFVDDGSQDGSANIIASHADPLIKLIQLSRNFGKEAALFAGLEHATGDATILMDADLQHPFSLVEQFIHHWQQGIDVVYAIRKNRENEHWLKRVPTKIFYHMLKYSTDVSIPPNAGDFRILSKRARQALLTCDERNLFMKGLYAWVGFQSLGIPYTVPERAYGKSQWNYKSLTELAITGITSFSNIPLRVWSLIGFAISALAMTYAGFIIVKTLLFGSDAPGFATLIVAIMFLGGIQLLSIGILGEYLAKVFNEVKKRPRYIIAHTRGLDRHSND